VGGYNDSISLRGASLEDQVRELLEDMATRPSMILVEPMIDPEDPYQLHVHL
jgi:hypothetical protein